MRGPITAPCADRNVEVVIRDSEPNKTNIFDKGSMMVSKSYLGTAWVK